MKKITLLIISSLFSCTSMLFGQVFQKTYGGTGTDDFYSHYPTSDGGYILGGETNSTANGDYDVWLVKTDANGTIVWSKTYGGVADDWANWVRPSADGGYIFSGATESFEVNTGHTEIYFGKTDGDGNLQWVKAIGSANMDFSNDYGVEVNVTSDGGFILCGYLYSLNTFQDQSFLIKLDSAGKTTWQKTFGLNSADLFTYSVRQTLDGGYILGGENYVGSYSLALIIKTDASGVVQWARQSVSNGKNDFWVNAVTPTSDGGYAVAGVGDESGNYDVWLGRFSSSGTLLWSKLYDGPSSPNDYGYNLQETKDHGFIVSGRTTISGSGNDAYILKTDSAGNLQWANRYGGSTNDFGSEVTMTQDGGYITAGGTTSFGDGWQGYLVKMNSLGSSGCNTIATPTTTKTAVTTFSSITPITFNEGVPLSFTTTEGTGGTETTLCFVTSVNETRQENIFSVYPNPAKERLTIELSSSPIDFIEIYDVLGNKIYSQEGNSKRITLTTVDWKSGIYLVKIKSGEEIFIRRIIIP